MTRDPSDGSVREKPETGIPASEKFEFAPGCYDPDSCARHKACMYIQCSNRVIDTSTSGLPITKGKAEYLARLAKSHEWLTEYFKRKIG